MCDLIFRPLHSKSDIIGISCVHQRSIQIVKVFLEVIVLIVVTPRVYVSLDVKRKMSLVSEKKGNRSLLLKLLLEEEFASLH